MFAYVATFALSFALGFIAHWWHSRELEAAVERIRRQKDTEIRNLREERNRFRTNADNVQHLSDCADAYRRGKEEGRHSPATQAERFARNFEGRRGMTTFVDTTKKTA